MDFSGFSDASFSPKAWINAALPKDRPAQGENLEGSVSTLIMKLQLYSQELNSSLEELSAQALMKVPKASLEIDHLSKEASLLKTNLQTLGSHVSKVADESNESVAVLRNLHSVQVRLDQCAGTLSRAQALSFGLQSLESLLTDERYSKASEEIHAMQQHAKELQTFDTIKNTVFPLLNERTDRLAVSLEPLLRDALMHHKTDTARDLVRMLARINRSHISIKSFKDAHSATIQSQWSAFSSSVEGGVSGNGGQQQFVKFLPKFYDEIVLFVNREASWSAQIFTSGGVGVENAISVNPVVPFLTEIFESLRPSMLSRLCFMIYGQSEVPTTSSMMQSVSPNGVPSLIDAHNSTLQFVRNLSTLLAPHTADPKTLSDLCDRILGPFERLMSEYGNLEYLHMSQLLNSLYATLASADNVASLEQSVPFLFRLFEESIDRCTQFTKGCGFADLCAAINKTIASFCEHALSVLKTVKSKHEIPLIEQQQQNLTSPIAGSVGGAQKPRSPMAPPATSPTTSTTSGAFLQHQGGDWTFSHISLSLLQTVLTLQQKFRSFSELLKRTISENSEMALCNATAAQKPALESLLRNQILAVELNGSIVSLKSLQKEIELLVFSSLFGFVRMRLGDMPKLTVWEVTSTKTEKAVFEVPTFSLTPSDYMAHIGEQLLTLPQQLDMLHGIVVASSEDSDVTSVKFWVDKVSNATVSLFCEQICKIKALSAHGLKQLATDVSYLENVLKALSDDPQQQLKDLLTLLSAKSDEEFKQALSQAKSLDPKVSLCLGFIRNAKQGKH